MSLVSREAAEEEGEREKLRRQLSPYQTLENLFHWLASQQRGFWGVHAGQRTGPGQF